VEVRNNGFDQGPIPSFRRGLFAAGDTVTRIGDGSLGGKASGLILARRIIGGLDRGDSLKIELDIPTMTVVATSMFDAFIERNQLAGTAASDLPDERIAHAFQQGDLPVEMLGDMKALMDETHAPLAVRSSSLLEDALYQPFAGVYKTKMLPNNQPDPDERFRKLVEAIKFVYASTFFAAAKSYVGATDRTIQDEKMAVIIQEVVGRRRGDLFYPEISGVARSYNFYPSGRARQEDGVVNLALGLGKTIVEGGLSWTYSPALPKAPPPYGSPRELLRNTQVKFWAVNIGKPPEYDPIAETEYLVEATLVDAAAGDALRHVVSTYDPSSDTLHPGTGPKGPWVVDFSPVLVLGLLPLNESLRGLLAKSEEVLGGAVEIEFAMTLEDGPTPQGRLGFLQVRPMVVPSETVEITDDELRDSSVIVASFRAMGNGVDDSLLDLVYVKPEAFDASSTRAIARQLDNLNKALIAENRPYVLIGFGRWGSSDPSLGIPVQWGQISGARVIVEATLPQMNVEASQGAHFFHNLSSFQVSYLTVGHQASPRISWDWLNSQETVVETDHVRQVRAARPVLVKVDGRSGRGGIWTGARD